MEVFLSAVEALGQVMEGDWPLAATLDEWGKILVPPGVAGHMG